MKRYLLRYLLFLAPALLVSLFFRNAERLSQILQWFTAFFMLFGWSVNTGMAAYRFPRDTLRAILLYTGANLISIQLVYQNFMGTRSGLRGRMMGILSFTPLQIFVRALIELNIQQEIWVLGLLVGGCLIGYFTGLLVRRISPDPYHPQIGV